VDVSWTRECGGCAGSRRRPIAGEEATGVNAEKEEDGEKAV
jgi:hypothetical protein